jgi:hypothetical protein
MPLLLLTIRCRKVCLLLKIRRRERSPVKQRFTRNGSALLNIPRHGWGKL